MFRLMGRHKKGKIVRRRIGDSFTEVETENGNRWVCNYVKNSGWCIFRNGSFVKKCNKRMQSDRIMMRMAVKNG